MNKWLGIAATLVLGAYASGAAATLVVDTTYFTATGTNQPGDYDDHGWGDVNRLDGTLDFVSWTHHFVFDPAFETIDSGVLALSLRDDGGWFDGIELGFGITESGQWDFGLVTTANYAYDIEVSSLADGSFSVLLASLFGDFYIDKSVLTIAYTPFTGAVTRVSEPGVVTLLGLGLIGLVVVRRARRR
jgi:hypothetical protein